jgi:hypothetical protein
MNKKVLYININIKEYDNFEDNIELINLIDKDLILQNETIEEAGLIIKFLKSKKIIYDYECIILSPHIHPDMNIVEDFIKKKFNNSQDKIKNKHKKFGQDWSIQYVIFDS